MARVRLTKSPTNLLRSAAGKALGVLIILHFAGFALFGPNGLLAFGGYRHAIAERAAELVAIKQQRDQIAHRVGLLDPKGVDPDYAEELIRRETGQVRPDEVIIPIR
jgi:cell division protein FtsB